MPGQPKSRAKLKAAEEKAARLQAALASQAQDLASAATDKRVAAALITAEGKPYTALRLFGKNPSNYTGERRAVLITRYIARPGVIAELQASLANLEKQKNAILSRQVQIALKGPNDESTRAASLLAKIAGWVKPTEFNKAGDTNQTIINIIKKGSTELNDALAKLAHEPGDPMPVYSEAIEALTE
jgi:hypothetical protein